MNAFSSGASSVEGQAGHQVTYKRLASRPSLSPTDAARGRSAQPSYETIIATALIRFTDSPRDQEAAGQVLDAAITVTIGWRIKAGDLLEWRGQHYRAMQDGYPSRLTGRWTAVFERVS